MTSAELRRIAMRMAPDHNWHPALMITIDGDEFGPFCGDSWCTGACGLPAAEIHDDGKPLKAMGNVVAVGPAWQRYRVHWTGDRVQFDDDLAYEARLRMWW